MPGARPYFDPATVESSVADDAHLQRRLQSEFEEDVARIFDESLYSDLELNCGKSKIRAHTCILKTRTKSFYKNLEKILHVNFGKNAYDEIYSFISDAYTECDIKKQEREIIEYLSEHTKDTVIPARKKNDSHHKGSDLNTKLFSLSAREISEKINAFSTPEYISPLQDITRSKVSSSPSTELIREYYALVPIDAHFLEKEIKEQEELSSAFQSIIKSQHQSSKKILRNKPTSLSLKSSHVAKNNTNNSLNAEASLNVNKLKNIASVDNKYSGVERSAHVLPCNLKQINTKCESQSKFAEEDKTSEHTISPDSLVSDDPSSSSDYVSAANNLSPGVITCAIPPHLNAREGSIAMDHAYTSSDSGLETSGFLESLNGQRDTTLTDTSLTESTLQDLTSDNYGSPSHRQQNDIRIHSSGPSFDSSESQHRTRDKGIREIPSRHSKEEKQRQNEEIVILESSSLSSETGSWESVFPLKINAEKDQCKAFLANERIASEIRKDLPKNPINTVIESSSNVEHKSPHKSTCCFIDAASLVDDDETKIRIQNEIRSPPAQTLPIVNHYPPPPSQPLPCSTAKLDSSPNDWSEQNENDDSLEQVDNKDPDSLQKDISPTIFDMTPITEDSLSTNPFETNLKLAEENKKTEKEEITGLNETKPQANVLREHISTSTPYNSIMSLRSSSVKQLDSEEGDSDSTLVSNESSRTNIKRLRKFTDASPIVSGGASIEDHLPQLSINSISPIVRRKIDNIPIVSGAAPEEEREIIPERKINKSHLSSSFVIDMSYKSEPNIHRKPADRTCENLKNQSRFIPSDNGSRSRSSVDSDSSEVSSHKFYIDLSSLPDPDTTSSSQNANTSEKKNIFSMYIDIGDKTTVKEMPARLSSSLNARRNPDSDAEVSSSPKANRKKKILKNLNNTDSLNNSTFEKYEALCSNPDISISEIVGNHNDTSGQVTKNVITKIIKENVTSLPKESKCKSENESSSDVFVRLSDLDRPSPQPTDDFSSIPKSHIPEIRMTRSIPGAAWDDSHSGVSKSSEVISSFHSENAVSLNRLFPHLKNEISRSMPGSLSTRTRSPLRLGSSHNGEFEEPISDGSKMSSVQSSYCRSIAENSTTDDSQTSSLIGNCQSKLGQDLLRMFLEEIAPDVVVEVSGRRFKAHKCILSSRCQYFAGILSGGWVESSGNVIILPPFSYNVVHFALCHIYSGVSTIPDSISIVELATIADMLGLEGLKEAIMFNLKMKYCHHFHKPCAVCTAGVLECFPLSSVYGLDDLYRKCLKWITKYFHKVWPTKAFATLPKELLDKCYQQHIINMTTENIVDTVVACGMTEASLHSSRWAETVAGMCRRLLNAAAHFAATRLREVCRACAAAAAAPPPAAAAALDACLATAIDWAPPDETCRTYSFLANIVKEIRSHQNPKPDVISNVDVLTVKSNFLCSRAAEWRARCERSVVRSALRVIDSEAYQELSPELRKRLKDLGCTVYDTKAANVTTSVQERKTKYPITRATKSQISSSRNMDIDHVRQSFVPYVAKPIMPVRSSVTRSSEDTARSGKSTSQPPKIRTTKAQEERAKYNIAITNKSREGVNNKVVSRPNKFDNTKSRYMEPKAMKDVEVRKPAMNRMSVKMISSSESSRNSSPVEARGGRLGRAGGRRHAHSQDSLLAAASRPRTADLSTDSLSESHATNKYATYTKTKHTNQIHEPTTVQPQSRRYLPANIKTKIPVYKNSYRCPEVTNKQNNINGSNSTGKSSVSSVHKSSERRVPTSLTSATKSSSAKIVTRANHPSTSTGLANGNKQKTKPKTANNKPVETKPLKEIPTMDRSGTFLKDEPTFGDKAIDVADSKII